MIKLFWLIKLTNLCHSVMNCIAARRERERIRLGTAPNEYETNGINGKEWNSKRKTFSSIAVTYYICVRELESLDKDALHSYRFSVLSLRFCMVSSNPPPPSHFDLKLIKSIANHCYWLITQQISTLSDAEEIRELKLYV